MSIKLGFPPIKVDSQTELEREQAKLEQKRNQRIAYEAQQVENFRKQRNLDKRKEDSGYKAMTSLKRERYQLEKDAQLIKNRIELLKKEELRIWKKIRDLHRKADEVMELKKKSDIRKKEKAVNEKKMKKVKASRNKGGKKEKEKTEKVLKIRLDLLKRNKRAQVESIKKQSQKLERKYKRMVKKKQLENQLKTQTIKNQKTKGKLHLMRFQEQKNKKVQDRWVHLQQKEKKLIKQVKKDLNRMCKVEEDWIGKLKSSQVIQNYAFDKLKSALNVEDESEEINQEEMVTEDSGEEGTISENDNSILTDQNEELSNNQVDDISDQELIGEDEDDENHQPEISKKLFEEDDEGIDRLKLKHNSPDAKRVEIKEPSLRDENEDSEREVK